MHVLVTGGSGFTGRYLRAELEGAGHDVVDLNARLDEAKAVACEVAAHAPDAVVHLAAIAFVGHDDARSFYDVNVVGTMNLLDALAAMTHVPRRVILASSANIYGPGEGVPLDEDSPPNPSNHYAVSKFAMERMSTLYRDRLPLVLARPFNYTGPGQDPNFVVPKIAAAFQERVSTIELGRTDVRRDFSDVRAICAAYRGLLEAERLEHDVYNLCSGDTRSVDEVIAICAEASGHHIAIERSPAFMRRGEIDVLVGSNSRLRKALPDWRPIPIEETLAAMVRDQESLKE